MSSRSILGLFVLCFGVSGLAMSADSEKERAATKKALSDVQEFIGPWKGNGEMNDGKKEIWKESVVWGWKFKGDDAWLTVEVTDGKTFDKGELKYLPEAKAYELTVTDKNKKESGGDEKISTCSTAES